MPEAVRLECRGNLHFHRRELQLAVDLYEAAIRADPGRRIARYQYLVGTQAELAGKFRDAFLRYQDAIEVEPLFLDAYVEMGGLLPKVGDLVGAVRAYRDAVRLAPRDAVNHRNLVAVLKKLAEADPEEYAEELDTARQRLEAVSDGTVGKDVEDFSW